MNAFNNFTMVGFICKDAEVKDFKNVNLVKFGIFVNEQKKEGEQQAPSAILNFERKLKKDDTKTIELLKKGSYVKVEGFFTPDCYTDKNGKKVNKVKLVATSIEPGPKKKEEKEAK